MEIPKDSLTVGKFKYFLKEVPPETEIIFRPARFSKTPLIYFRFKERGTNLLHIELNEWDEENQVNESELYPPPTAGEFLERLNFYGDDWKLSFGFFQDGEVLECKSVTNIVSVDLGPN